MVAAAGQADCRGHSSDVPDWVSLSCLAARTEGVNKTPLPTSLIGAFISN